MDTLLAFLKAPTAPIPFSVVVVAVATVVWGTFQWFYKERIEKIKHLFELSQLEVDLQSKISKRTQGELEKDLQSVKGTLAKATSELAKATSEDQPKNLRVLIDTASETTNNAALKVGELGK